MFCTLWRNVSSLDLLQPRCVRTYRSRAQVEMAPEAPAREKAEQDAVSSLPSEVTRSVFTCLCPHEARPQTLHIHPEGSQGPSLDTSSESPLWILDSGCCASFGAPTCFRRYRASVRGDDNEVHLSAGFPELDLLWPFKAVSWILAISIIAE